MDMDLTDPIATPNYHDIWILLEKGMSISQLFINDRCKFIIIEKIKRPVQHKG